MYFPDYEEEEEEEGEEEIAREEEERKKRKERKKTRLFLLKYRKNEKLGRDKYMIYTSNNADDFLEFYFVSSSNNKTYFCSGMTSMIDFGEEILEIYPEHVPFLDNKKIKKISVQKNHHLFLLHNGTVFGKGENRFGELCLKNPIKTFFEKAKNNFMKISYMTTGMEYFKEKEKELSESLLPEYNKESNFIILLNMFKTTGRYPANQFAPKKITVYDQHNQKNVKIKDIFTGKRASFFICENNKVYAGGKNKYGKLGVGDFKHRYFADKVMIQERVLTISCSHFSTMFLTMNGIVYGSGMIRTRDFATQNVPVNIIRNLGNLRVLKIFNSDSVIAYLTDNYELHLDSVVDDFKDSLKEKKELRLRKMKKMRKKKRIVNIKGNIGYIILSEVLTKNVFGDKSFYLIPPNKDFPSRDIKIPTSFLYGGINTKDIQIECFGVGFLFVSKNKLEYEKRTEYSKSWEIMGDINIKRVRGYEEKEEKKERLQYLIEKSKDIDEYGRKRTPEFEPIFSKIK